MIRKEISIQISGANFSIPTQLPVFRAQGNKPGKSMGACVLFKDGWVERIIDVVKAVRPDAKSEVLDNPLWDGTDGGQATR